MSLHVVTTQIAEKWRDEGVAGSSSFIVGQFLWGLSVYTFCHIVYTNVTGLYSNSGRSLQYCKMTLTDVGAITFLIGFFINCHMRCSQKIYDFSGLEQLT
jgi:hypothetical protein